MTTTDRIKTLELAIKTLNTRVSKLQAYIDAVNDKDRRGSATVNFAAQATQTVAVSWTKPYPDTVYAVLWAIYTTSPAQVHAVPIPATKTTTGISFTVVAASGVGDVTLDVIAERTAV